MLILLILAHFCQAVEKKLSVKYTWKHDTIHTN